MAEVYVALSDEQCLRLAQRHNVNSHFVHHITHRDLVSVYHILVRAYLQLIGIHATQTTYYVHQPCIHSCNIPRELFLIITAIFDILRHDGQDYIE